MKTLFPLIKRNVKMFFKDRGMVISALITPIILLVLYATFLAKVYKDSFTSSLPDGVTVDAKIINGLVGGELFSSLLAVCCITVAFVSNLIIVQDKATGTIKDFTISPVKPSTLSLSYYIATFINTLLICAVASIMCFIYLAIVGWYMSVLDVLLVFFDVFLLVMFGTALSCIVNSFLSTQGQMSAVGTIVSAGYGFICGAYMPLSNFPVALRNVVSFLPGTYGTSLIRNHAMRGSFDALKNAGFPQEVIKGLKDGVDCNLYFFGNSVSVGGMLAVMCISVTVLVAVYVVINVLRNKSK